MLELTTHAKALVLMTLKLRVAGDLPGHEFHGNQYVSGSAEHASFERGFYHGQTGYGFQKHVAGRKGSTLHKAYRKGYDVGVDASGDLRHASAHRDNNLIHRAADAHYRQMMLVVSAAFMRGKKAYKSGGTDKAVSAIRASLLKDLPAVLLKAVGAGGNVGLRALPKSRDAEQHVAACSNCEEAGISGEDCQAMHMGDMGTGYDGDRRKLRTLKPQVKGQPHDVKGNFGLAFNVTDPNAVAWAKEHAAELADGISETSRERIANAVAAALEGDDEALDDILEAVGSEARADVIARTEVMTAANEGQRLGWDQAVEAGLLPEDVKVAWIATSGCCDECDDLDGEERTLDGEYPDPGGDGPPLHPNCRCTEGIA